MDPVDLIWKNGEFVPWEDAQTHVLSHGLHYGTGVFEGIRCYETPRGPAIFRHQTTSTGSRSRPSSTTWSCPTRPRKSARRRTSCCAATACAPAYIRPLAYRGYGSLGLYAKDAPVDVIIAAFPWGAYLGEESKNGGIRAKVSSWRRISPGGSIPHAKASGSYLNSILAKTESTNAGYDEAILLDERGFVCEGSGENIFVVRDGEIVTPPQVASILDGINRKSVIQIARDLGYTVVERDLARAELYLAEEVFLTGTAAELVPVREIDDHPLGEPGEITRHVQAKFEDALCGKAEEYLEWLDFVETPEPRLLKDRLLGPTARVDRANYPRRLSGRRGVAAHAGPRPARSSSIRKAVPMEQVKLYDTTLRDGMGGQGMSLSVGEKLKVVARPRRARRALHRGRIPEQQPEGSGALRAARRARARAGDDRRLRDDPPPRHAPPRTTRR